MHCWRHGCGCRRGCLLMVVAVGRPRVEARGSGGAGRVVGCAVDDAAHGAAAAVAAAAADLAKLVSLVAVRHGGSDGSFKGGIDSEAREGGSERGSPRPRQRELLAMAVEKT